MISSISAYREMMVASGAEKTAVGARRDQGLASAGADVPAADSVELSVSSDVFSAVDNYFNLGASGRFDSFHSLSPADKEQFVKIVAALAQAGYVGYEELVVNKKIEKHDVLDQIADDRLRNAKVYNPPKTPQR